MNTYAFDTRDMDSIATFSQRPSKFYEVILKTKGSKLLLRRQQKLDTSNLCPGVTASPMGNDPLGDGFAAMVRLDSTDAAEILKAIVASAWK